MMKTRKTFELETVLMELNLNARQVLLVNKRSQMKVKPIMLDSQSVVGDRSLMTPTSNQLQITNGSRQRRLCMAQESEA